MYLKNIKVLKRIDKKMIKKFSRITSNYLYAKYFRKIIEILQNVHIDENNYNAYDNTHDNDKKWQLQIFCISYWGNVIIIFCN